MARPKIALVNVFFPPQSIGGATRVVAENFAVLRGMGEEFDLTAFAIDAGGQAPHTLEAYVHGGVRVYRAGAVRRPNVDWHAVDPGMGEVFGRFLDFEKPDLVHFHCIQRLTGSVVEATIARRIPYVVTIHDAWWISDFQFLTDRNGRVYPEGHPDGLQHGISLPAGISPSASSERRRYLAGLLNQASRVLAVSRSFADIYRSNGIQRVGINSNGIRQSPHESRQPSADGRLRLAHVGGMSRHKGYDLFHKVLAGGGFRNLSALVVDLSKPFGYERSDDWNGLPVTFVGKYPQHRMAALFARMDVLVAPSVWPESFGLVTREAAQAGVWVVASDRGGIGEDVEAGINGNVVDVSDTNGLRECLQRLDMEPEPYRQSLEPPLVRSVEDQVRELVAHYREILVAPGNAASGAGEPSTAPLQEAQ